MIHCVLTNGECTVTILTQSADYVQLGMNDAVTPIASPLYILSVETVTDNCLVASAFTWYVLSVLSDLLIITADFSDLQRA